MTGTIDFGKLAAAVESVRPWAVSGRVTGVSGCAVKAKLPVFRTGEVAEIETGSGRVEAEIVGFDGTDAIMVPLGSTEGIETSSRVSLTGRSFEVSCGDGLIGRVVDAFGRPIDGSPLPEKGLVRRSVDAEPPQALSRLPVEAVFETGLKAVDGLITAGIGQRVGIFSAAGVGKSTLLGQIARHSASTVNVICLTGERGREVKEFVESCLGPEGLMRSVVVASTSDQPPVVRLKAAFSATAIAEHFRERGENVLLLVDSLTRVARAAREIGLAAGEAPARRGYPPSVFAMLPRLLERAGNSERGSITAFYTVLVEGNNMDEPVVDEVRSILDGHVVLSREMAEANRFPAIDVLRSLSRVMSGVAGKKLLDAAGKLRSLLAAYEKNRDLLMIGAYSEGSDPRTDFAVRRMPAIEAFLRQSPGERIRMAETEAKLVEVVEGCPA